MQHESYVVRQDRSVARQKLSSYLVFQLVARHHLNVCDISACFATKYCLSKYDVKTIFSITF